MSMTQVSTQTVIQYVYSHTVYYEAGIMFLKSYRTENDWNRQEYCHEPEEEDCKPALGPGQEPHQLEWVDHNNVPG